MSFHRGLTSLCIRTRGISMIWRWNMSLGDARHTLVRRRFGQHGYIAAGPLILEW